jgi:hypothetical protein
MSRLRQGVAQSLRALLELRNVSPGLRDNLVGRSSCTADDARGFLLRSPNFGFSVGLRGRRCGFGRLSRSGQFMSSGLDCFAEFSPFALKARKRGFELEDRTRKPGGPVKLLPKHPQIVKVADLLLENFSSAPKRI